MDVAEVLRKSWAAVEEANVPPQVQEVAFREAVRLMAPPMTAPPSVTQALVPPGHSRGRAGEAAPALGDADTAEAPVTENALYDRVVEHTGVDRQKLEQVVHLDGSSVRVSLPGLKLGRNNAERARAVAQILTITRGFGFEESETSLEIIRRECDRLKVYDQANFSAHIKALNGYVITGSGQARRVRPKSGGVESFPALIESLGSSL